MVPLCLKRTFCGTLPLKSRNGAGRQRLLVLRRGSSRAHFAFSPARRLSAVDRLSLSLSQKATLPVHRYFLSYIIMPSSIPVKLSSQGAIIRVRAGVRAQRALTPARTRPPARCAGGAGRRRRPAPRGNSASPGPRRARIAALRFREPLCAPLRGSPGELRLPRPPPCADRGTSFPRTALCAAPRLPGGTSPPPAPTVRGSRHFVSANRFVRRSAAPRGNSASPGPHRARIAALRFREPLCAPLRGSAGEALPPPAPAVRGSRHFVSANRFVRRSAAPRGNFASPGPRRARIAALRFREPLCAPLRGSPGELRLPRPPPCADRGTSFPRTALCAAPRLLHQREQTKNSARPFLVARRCAFAAYSAASSIAWLTRRRRLIR